MTPEEIAELRRLEKLANDDTEIPSVNWRRYRRAILMTAPALLCAAEIAARVPERCCISCFHYPSCEDMRRGKYLIFRCDDWEVME